MTFVGTRRAALALGAAVAAGLPMAAKAAGTFRVGYQKYGAFTLVKARGTLEKRLAGDGIEVTWTEFAAGPQLLEGLNVGSVDIATVGEAPPIFAQAAGAPLVYVGYEPANPKGEAILVPKGSTLTSVKELAGKRVALNKGSNVHYFLVKALEFEGLSIKDVQTAFLPPADARAAFDRGAVDAWAIWDPFFAVAEEAVGARILRDGEGVVANHQFYLASKDAFTGNGKAVRAMLAELTELGPWVTADPERAARALAAETRIDLGPVLRAVQRTPYDVRPLDDKTIAAQQKIADTFFDLGIVPKRVKVADAVPDAARSF